MKNLFLVLVTLLLTACTTTSPYRTEFSRTCEYVKKNDCPQQSISIGDKGQGTEYLLSFYEYDEQGMLHQPEPRKRIVETYRKIAKENDVLLITFFHGWHHNAKGLEEDNDIVQFRKVLSKAALSHPDKKILGIYVGWRGRSLVGFLDYLTFWGRKHTAHEVGQLGGVTEALLELESMVKESNNPKSKMVTIGHSFGGAALYSTIGHVLSERFTSSRLSNPEGVIEGFGDLVVLLNPAFEASRYTSLFELSQNDCVSFSKKQTPRLVSLSSKADKAVRLIFQAGQFFNAISEEHRNTLATHCVNGKKESYQLRQFRADVNGIGHYRPFISHDLSAQAPTDSFSTQSDKVDISTVWSENIAAGRVSFNLTNLSSRNISDQFNPFMNIYTDSKVMGGHNDIWTDEVLDFLNEIIKVSTF